MLEGSRARTRGHSVGGTRDERTKRDRDDSTQGTAANTAGWRLHASSVDQACGRMRQKTEMGGAEPTKPVVARARSVAPKASSFTSLPPQLAPTLIPSAALSLPAPCFAAALCSPALYCLLPAALLKYLLSPTPPPPSCPPSFRPPSPLHHPRRSRHVCST